MDVNQEMDVIRFSAEFNRRAMPGSKDFGKGGFEIFEPFRRPCFATVFSNKNDRQLNVKNCV